MNVSAEPAGKESAIAALWRRRPGLTSFADPAVAGYRGGILVNGLLYIVVGTTVKTIDSDGVVTDVGTLAGSDKVSFARNNETTPKIQCVSPANGAFAVTSASVTSFTGGGALPAPNSTCGQDGYIFWLIGDNRLFAAGPNSTTVNANTYTTVQSRPTGNALRVVPYKGQLLCFASRFLEIYANTANAFPKFPYTRYAVIDCGLYGRNAIAGWEDGFGALHWVGPGPEGLCVYGLNGPEPVEVSPPDLDRLIQAIPEEDADTLEAFCYQADGKNFWVLSSPTWTWELNLNTRKWNERDSLSGGLAVRWRATGPSVNAFGRWFVGDSLDTDILYIDPTSEQENGNRIRFRMESAAVVNFPNRTQIARADFNFVTGVGQSSSATETGRNPKVAIACSRDGGVHWDNSRFRELGEAANGRRRVYVTNCGMSGPYGTRWRLDLTDEVFASFSGGTMSADPRAN